MESRTPLFGSSSSPDAESPIPLGSNYHTGAFLGTSPLTLTPAFITHDPASFTNPGPSPILPRRFNDDITDGHMSSAHGSPNERGPLRTASVPSSPIIQHTGNAPSVTAAAAAASHQQTLATGCHHNHRTRFEHQLDEDDEAVGERDTMEVPSVRPSYEKDENGVFQFAATAAHPSFEAGGLMMRNRSNQNLQSMAAPAGSGAGPRAPPVNLISSSLAGSNILRTTSGDGSFHPHGTEKLPYNRVVIDYAPSVPSAELKQIGTHIRRCLELRAKFVWTPLRSEQQYNIFDNPPYVAPTLEAPLPPARSNVHFEMVEGVFVAWAEPPSKATGDSTATAPPAADAASPSQARDISSRLAAAASASASASSSLIPPAPEEEESVSSSSSRLHPGNEMFEAPSRAEFGQAMATVMDLVISGPASQ